jgi:hypothetical protein
MRLACGDVRDHVVSHKNDHGPSYRVTELAAAATSKNQISRNFRCRSIFDFCNSICQIRTFAPTMLSRWSGNDTRINEPGKKARPVAEIPSA